MRFNLADNPVAHGLSKVFDVACLNILWLVCCIPVVTAGAATTALYAVMLKLVKNEEGYIFRGYFSAFKNNFKQSTVVWCGLLVLSLLLGADWSIVSMLSGAVSIFFRIVLMFAGFCLFGTAIYVFPLLARYENPLRATVKNAALLAIGRLPYTVLLMIVTACPLIVSVLSVRYMLLSLPLWFGIGFAGIAWVNSHILRRVFRILDEKQGL